MLSKEQIAASMARECDICKHVFEKLPASSYSYRPTPKQRSTVELLRYLSICGIAGTQSLAQSNWKVFREYVARTGEMVAEEFPAMMDRQKHELNQFFHSITERELETQDALLPIGGTQLLGQAILDLPFKWLPAYKLQLFLYAKANGVTQIGTSNAWMGIDWKG